MANTPSIDLKQLKADIVKLNKKSKKVEKIMNKDYPRNYREITEKYVNPHTGKPISKSYVMLVRKQLEEEGKI